MVFPAGKAVFELGADAARWLDRIKNPKSVLDKLGVKPEHAVALLGVFPKAFVDDLKARARRVVPSKALADADVLFLAAEARSDLAQLPRVAESIQRSGTLWVVRPKGVESITEREVLEAGKAAGLVDVKVVRFSESHTAEKFVVPVARR